MASTSGWTAGVVHHGPPARERQEAVQHIVRMTTAVEMADHYVSADEAIRQRIQRLKDSRTPFMRDGMTLQFSGNGQEITLEYL